MKEEWVRMNRIAKGGNGGEKGWIMKEEWVRMNRIAKGGNGGEKG
jgi:hypothetical protein